MATKEIQMKILFWVLTALWAVWCIMWGMEAKQEAGSAMPIGVFVFALSVMAGAMGLSVIGCFAYKSWWMLVGGAVVAAITYFWMR